MTEPKVTRRKITEYAPDAQNANRGTERGHRMLDDSVTEVGLGRSVVADKNGKLIGGNKTQQAAVDNGFEDAIEIETDGKTLVVVKRTDLDLNDPEPNNPARRMAYYDNRVSAVNLDFDPAVLLHDMQTGVDLSKLWTPDELAELLAGIDATESTGESGTQPARPKLADRFIIPPFSVLDARQGYWQERKRQWLSIGIQSELGRGGGGGTPPHPPTVTQNQDGTLNYSGTGGQAQRFDRQRIKGRLPADSGGQPLPLDRTKNGKSPARTFAQDLMRGEHVVGSKVDTQAIQTQSRIASVKGEDFTGLSANQSGTSIFDPVLCELAYRWFSPPAGHVLDPFAGGSVRGIVAALLNRRYTGIDLRAEQVAANQAQAVEIVKDTPPNWITGDSRNIDTLTADTFDFIFSCPPYFDLEIYSDNDSDLSNAGDYAAFLTDYRAIIAAACTRLKTNRFACFVVGDIRDKRGMYRNFVSDTIAAFLDAGLHLYNEAILVTAAGSLPIRVGKQFESGRKLGKTHQNVLVFIKGDPKQAVVDCGQVEVYLPDEFESGGGDSDGEYGERLTLP